MYSANSATPRCTLAVRLNTSTMYEMAWNVKNEMPSGSGIVATDNGATLSTGASVFRFETAKFAYLKMASTPRFAVTPTMAQRLRAPACGASAMRIPIHQFSAIEPRISGT